ncbi:hypothetical protein WSM22_27170 [Cytophagales bacterium WSM2-2]|nr:hypothetical protein WSM22_27170 [Cytophagales bacterium WSM2-2]
MLRSILALLILTLPTLATGQVYQNALKGVEKLKNGNTDGYYEASFAVADHYKELTDEQRTQIREGLNANPLKGKVKLTSPGERGIKIRIKGQLVDKNGKPVANASIEIYQADARGCYAPTDSVNKIMSEHDPRLFAYIVSDENGKFEFETIEPKNYPFPYESSLIPAHIHFNISANSFAKKELQLAFANDPSMKEKKWKLWAKENQFPVLQLAQAKDGMKEATLSILMLGPPRYIPAHKSR